MKDKNHYLNDSKVFCMFPWVHLNVTPKGDVYPCCSNNYTTPVASTKTSSLADAFNCDEMKQIRLNMINDQPSKICEFCYKHEEASPYSFRQYSKEHFGKYFDELIPFTQSDGTVDDFKMRYLDILELFEGIYNANIHWAHCFFQNFITMNSIFFCQFWHAHAHVKMREKWSLILIGFFFTQAMYTHILYFK